MTENYTLYGIPASLYTGKVRSYLRKQRIPFVERAFGDPDFTTNIRPRIGRMIMPIVETPDGSLLQDGADIIEYFESQPEGILLPAQPPTPVQAAVANLFELFGGEGLLRPAMHYRWNFDETNLAFLKDDFCAGLAAGASEPQKDQIFDFASNRMRKMAVGFGVTQDSIPLIEKSYAEFLDLFSKHLTTSPYLLGGHPTIGDYGLIAPLYAHLGRDPYPAQLLRRTAPKVSRWVERMHAPEQVAVEYGTLNQDLFPDDSIPSTLKNLMCYVAEEYLPEIEAHVEFANNWLDQHQNLETGTNGCESPGKRFIGMTQFDWRGIRLETLVMPYRFYLLQKLQDGYAAAKQKHQQAILGVFTETGLTAMLELKTHRRVERENFLEVWGPDLRATWR